MRRPFLSGADMGGFQERLLVRSRQLPDWLASMLVGPTLVFMFFVSRGGIVLLPVLAVYFIFFSHDRLGELLHGAEVVLLLLIAAALGGPLHLAVGRRIARIPVVGPALAGVLATVPYMVSMGFIIQLVNTGSFATPWDPAVYWACAICSVLFGSLFGSIAFRTEDPRAG